MGPVILPIPYRDPLVAFAPLAKTPMAVLLDSALATAQARASYIAIDPRHVIRAGAHPWQHDPFAAVADALGAKRESVDLPVPFTGGAIGLFSYELGGVLETLPPPKAQMFADDMVVGLYDLVAAFDHASRRAWVIARGPDAMERATALVRRLGTAPLPPAPGPVQATWRAETSQTQHEANVRAAIDFIRAGDIFQANITQRFIAATPGRLDWFGVYRRLRTRAPGPFSAFLNFEGVRLLAVSPERFLRVSRNGAVEARPIKGTRPRGQEPKSDMAFARELRASAKDRAENLMIVDLLRNDLGRVCEPGSITVPVLQGLESFPTVHHLVSVVTGQLRKEASAVDLLRACFPGGSVTGAPKIRAMEIIHQLEAGPRGPYCGTIAWVGFDGAMDSSIVIRSLVGDDMHIYAQAGGGIVADSDPALEYAESLVKAAPMLAALNGAAL